MSSAMEQQELAELDFDIPCRVQDWDFLNFWLFRVKLSKPVTCTEPAAFVSFCTNCWHREFVCAEHRALIETAQLVKCTFCSTEGVENFLFVPLAVQS